jgi:hypothetical protein
MTSPRATQRLDLRVKQFLLPKTGHDLPECEDAIVINPSSYRFAIADGATEAFDSRNWAYQLAKHWAFNTNLLSPDNFWRWVEEEGRALDESWTSLQLSWYAEEKARAGSFAAFVGVEVDLEEQGWRAIALGDSCVFHCRDNALVKAMPLDNPKSFSSCPILTPSRTAMQSQATEAIVVATGELRNGDEIVMLSDAAAAWYLELVENKSTKVIETFVTLLNHTDREVLTRFFEGERLSKRLKDDDVAIIRIEV